MHPESIHKFFNQYCELLQQGRVRALTQLFHRRCLLADSAGLLNIHLQEELIPNFDTMIQLHRSQGVRYYRYRLKNIEMHSAGIARCDIIWLGLNEDHIELFQQYGHYELGFIDGRWLIVLLLDAKPTAI